jgi:hypothetical protein
MSWMKMREEKKIDSQKNQQIEETKDRIRRGNEIHLEETAFLVKELGIAGIGSGFELGEIPHITKIETKEEHKEMNLASTIYRLWGDAGCCYKYRRFRACAILLACLVEAVICFELTKRKIPYDTRWTLGNLINYCKGNKVKGFSPPKEIEKIFSKVIEDAKEINKLRIEAVHFKSEKEKSEDVEKWDELVPLEKFKSPPIKVSKSGWISGDDATLSLVLVSTGYKPFIVYKFKRMAEKTYRHTQNILKNLYGLKFVFGKKWNYE